MASRGERVQVVTAFFSSWAPKSQVGDCSHEIKRPLPLGKKAMTNIDSVLKSKGKEKKQRHHFVNKGSF